MVTSIKDANYTAASNDELDALLAGREAGSSMSARALPFNLLEPETVGVFWVRGPSGLAPVRPLVVICRDDEVQRLCGRYAQLRSDLSPLSPWCHLITTSVFGLIDELTPELDLVGGEAAWTGAVVAEAMLTSGKSLAGVSLQHCLATQSYSLARCSALWPRIRTSDVLDRFDAAARLFRYSPSRLTDIRQSFMTVWTCLSALAQKGGELPARFYPLVEAVERLRDARRGGYSDDASGFARALSRLVPDAEEFGMLASLAPEARLRLFDRLVDQLQAVAREQRSQENPRRHALSLLAGYLSTVAAGGAPSLALLDGPTGEFPELLCWAFVAGSIGERVLWTSSFEGLGRLVAREIMRPFQLIEPPTCDISIDEAHVIVDAQLSDPLVHLRLKQLRTAIVALLPGVNVGLPIDTPHFAQKRDVRKESDRPSMNSTSDSIVAAFIDTLRPLIRQEVQIAFKEHESSERRQRQSGRGAKAKRGQYENARLPIPKK